ncbi:MAG TPA: glycosyltransferase family 9 protein [Gemmatimonadales bacterium]|nr:glycosyltransferase family 9 protein [Gemmatimonadales bacterium]
MTAHLRAAGGRVHRALLRGLLRLLSPRVGEPVPAPRVRRILVSGSMGIGNAIMMEPLLRALREHYPQAHLAAAVERRSASLALLRWPGLVDEIVEVEGRNRWTRLVAGLRLARRRWDLCIVRFNGAAYEMVIAAIFGRIPWRAGHVTSGRFVSSVDWLFNLPVTMGEFEHEVDRYLGLAERLGHRPTRRVPRLQITAADRAAGERVLAQLGARADRPLIAIQPGSSPHQTWKRWPIVHWRELIRGLQGSGFDVIAMGSVEERELIDEVCRDSGAFNAAGVCSLPEAAAVLERSELLVCGDSALMHLAAAVGTPVVGIFGPTDRTRTGPSGEGHATLVSPACPHAAPGRAACLDVNGNLSPACTWERCLGDIGPERVLAAVLERRREIAC